MTILKDATPKAKKRHTCMICGCAIEPGTRYRYQVNDYDGFCVFRGHIECCEFYFRVRDDHDEEVCPDYTEDMVLDELTDVLGGRDKARDFKHHHDLHQCVQFLEKYGKESR